MSLNWSVEQCENADELLEGDEWQITQSLIFVTMSVGMGEITKANVKEFAVRVATFEALWGSTMRQGGEPRFMPLQDIVRRIGLTTNVALESRTQWAKWQMKQKMEALDRSIELELTELSQEKEGAK